MKTSSKLKLSILAFAMFSSILLVTPDSLSTSAPIKLTYLFLRAYAVLIAYYAVKLFIQSLLVGKNNGR